MKKEFLLYSVAPVCFIIGSIIGISIGSKLKESDWLLEKNKYLNEISKAQSEIRDNELLHREKESALLYELAQIKEQHEKTINDINNNYTVRLRQSEDRANNYKRSAQNNANCTALANTASKLDRTLEEGINLVEQLEKTSRLQQQHLDACMKIIENDRKLIND